MPQERSVSCLIIMMITRFNAECKEYLEGKGKFSEKERVAIGSASMMGIPYRIAEKQFDISRTYYHELGKKADCALEKLCASEQTTEPVIVLKKAFRERLIVSLTCRGMSAANITAFAEEMFGYSISGGTIWNTLKKVSEKADAAEKSVSLENIVVLLENHIGSRICRALEMPKLRNFRSKEIQYLACPKKRVK